jgi:hypothetical protein
MAAVTIDIMVLTADERLMIAKRGDAQCIAAIDQGQALFVPNDAAFYDPLISGETPVAHIRTPEEDQ